MAYSHDQATRIRTPYINTHGFTAAGPSAGMRGVTLIELVITLVVASVLATVAVPQFAQVVQNERLAGQVNEFVLDLNFARSEAVKRAVNVAVCPGTESGGCGGSWSAGRIVFVDADGNDAWTAGETVLRVHGSLADGYTLTASATAPVVVFSGTGTLALTAGGTALGAGTYAFCRGGIATSGKQISIQTLGRVSALPAPPTGC